MRAEGRRMHARCVKREIAGEGNKTSQDAEKQERLQAGERKRMMQIENL